MASIKKVADELNAGKDYLSKWASGRGDDFFLAPDGAVLSALQTVSAWATGKNYEPGAVNYERGAVATFLKAADYWLVAHAWAHEYTIVTHEVSDARTHEIKIPDACRGLKISCVGPYKMLKRERAKFVLGPAKDVA